MIKNFNVLCCFCNDGIESTDIDPCDINILTNSDKPENKQGNQNFWCHFNCFREKLDKNVQQHLVVHLLTDTESERIIANDIYVDIEELKKIIEKWQSGEFYSISYHQGIRGERLYEVILGETAEHANNISDKIIENVKKQFGSEVEVDFSIYPKSDIRSVGLEVLKLFNIWSKSIEKLTTDDIPAILEFLDTPPEKSLKAWDKWEKYWANLDYPARRKKLLEYNELATPGFPENKYLTNTKIKLTISKLNLCNILNIKSANEAFDILHKEFEGKKLIHETIEMLNKDTSRIFYEFEDGNFINLLTKSKLGEVEDEITINKIKKSWKRCEKINTNFDDPEKLKKLPEYYNFKILGFPDNDYITTLDDKITICRSSYSGESGIKKANEIFHVIRKEFHGRTLLKERVEILDNNAIGISYDFEDGSCIQLIT